MIVMRHPATGITKNAPQGYSWTMLLFGAFVPLFRGDLKHAAILFCITFLVALIAGPLAIIVPIVYAGLYNNLYYEDLLMKGFVRASVLDADEKRANSV